jgi:aquaglyceroporin related protein
MVAPFLGCLTGGFLYDVFIYTGAETPINTPFMGFTRLFRPKRSVWSNTFADDAANKA